VVPYSRIYYTAKRRICKYPKSTIFELNFRSKRYKLEKIRPLKRLFVLIVRRNDGDVAGMSQTRGKNLFLFSFVGKKFDLF